MFKRTSRAPFLILICIIMFHILNNYLWIKNDLLSWYPEKYYQLSFKNHILFSLKDILQSNASNVNKICEIFKLLDTKRSWPGLFHLYTSILNLIFGNRTEVSLLSNMPFFAILIISVFLIGKKIAGNKEGVLAAFLISFYPGIFGISRSYGLDFPTITTVTLCIYILILAKDFRKMKYILFFSSIMTLCILINGASVFFIIGPLAYVFYRFVFQRLIHKKNNKYIKLIALQSFLGLSFSLGLVFLSTSVWWLSNLKDFFQNVLDELFISPQYPYNLPLPKESIHKWLFFYLPQIYYSISPSLFLFFLFSVLLFLKKKIKYKLVLLIWLFIPYFIFTLITNKHGRYLFPVFPALALITAMGVWSIEHRKIKLFSVVLVLILSLFQFYDLSFGTAMLPEKIFYPKLKGGFGARPPQKSEDAKVVDKFFDLIYKEKNNFIYPLRILLVGTPDLIDSGKLEYLFELKGKDIYFKKFFIRISDYRECDYIIAVNRNNEMYGLRPKEEKRYLSNIDLTYVRAFNYKDFLASNYPHCHYSAEDFKEAYDFFSKFKVLYCYVTRGAIFYLAKNPKEN